MYSILNTNFIRYNNKKFNIGSETKAEDLRGAPQNVRRLKVICMGMYVACDDNKKDVWNCAGPRKTKAVPVQKNKIKSMTVDIYRCGDVERNPGPNPVLSLELFGGSMPMSRALVETPPANIENEGGERIFICSGIMGKRELGAKFAKWGTQELLAMQTGRTLPPMG